MTTNLEAARSAITAEIIQAKARVAMLEQTLAQIVEIGADDGDTTQTPTNAHVKPAAKNQSAKGGKRHKSAKGSSGLPFTGGDFWLNLVTKTPQSNGEILKAAIAGLGFAPTEVQEQKLAGRLTFAINALVNSGAIQDSGKGRGRRFFKAKG